MHERRKGKRERAREAAHFDGVSGAVARIRPTTEDAALPIGRRKTNGVGRIAARVIERLVAQAPMRALVDATAILALGL